MKIIHVTDIHSYTDKLELLKRIDADLIVVSGDLIECGEDLNEYLRVLEEFRKLNVKVLYVPGNCDPREALDIPSEENIVNLHGNYFKYGKYIFVGLGGSGYTPFNTPLEFSEDELESILEKTLSKVLNSEKISIDKLSSRLILVSHTPPLNTRIDMLYSGAHVGSLSVREFIEKYRPILGLHGHIHEAVGIDRVEDTVIVNPGPLRYGNCAIIDVSESDVKIEIRRL